MKATFIGVRIDWHILLASTTTSIDWLVVDQLTIFGPICRLTFCTEADCISLNCNFNIGLRVDLTFMKLQIFNKTIYTESHIKKMQ